VQSYLVNGLAKEGFQSISMNADRNDAKGNVGYAVWPKMGFDTKIPDDVRGSALGRLFGRGLPKQYANAQTVGDLMNMPGGADWWKANGHSVEASFDLTEGSRSRQALDLYNSKRAARGEKHILPGDTKMVGQTPLQRAIPDGPPEIDLNPQEEADLDAAWAELRKKRPELFPQMIEDTKAVQLALRVENRCAFLPVQVQLEGKEYNAEAVIYPDVAEEDGLHPCDVPEELLKGLRARLILPERKQVVYLSWPEGITSEPVQDVKEWDEAQHPRGPDGKFGGGGDVSVHDASRPGMSNNQAEAELHQLMQKVAGKIGADIKKAEETPEGKSAVQKGVDLARRAAGAVKTAVATAVQKTEGALGKLAERAPNLAAKAIKGIEAAAMSTVDSAILSRVLTDVTNKPGVSMAANLTVKAIAWSVCKARGIKKFEVWLEATELLLKHIQDNGTGDDLERLQPEEQDAIIQLGVQAAREALAILEDETDGAFEVPDDAAIETLVRRMFDGKIGGPA